MAVGFRPGGEQSKMMQSVEQERRRKNIRLALLLGVFALFILVTSFPFWQGLFEQVIDIPR